MPLRIVAIALVLCSAIFVTSLAGCDNPGVDDGIATEGEWKAAAPTVSRDVVAKIEPAVEQATAVPTISPDQVTSGAPVNSAGAASQEGVVTDPSGTATLLPTETVAATATVEPTSIATSTPDAVTGSSAPPSAQPVTVVPRPTAFEVVVGSLAPDLGLVDLDGAPQRLADRTGRIVLLNFWASWCGHCRSEIPYLNTIYGEYRDQGLEIVAVSVGEDPAEVASFAQQNNITFPVLVDAQGTAIVTYRLRAIPTSYFLNDQGVVQEIFNGAFTEEALREIVEDLLRPEEG